MALSTSISTRLH